MTLLLNCENEEKRKKEREKKREEPTVNRKRLLLMRGAHENALPDSEAEACVFLQAPEQVYSGLSPVSQ
jgi:hypothetical protein